MFASITSVSSVALYAAYGSNMDPVQMKARCPHSPVYSVGWLQDMRLAFGGEDVGWEGSIATVVEAAGSQVFVMLYDVEAYDEKVLDHYEQADTGLYSKIKVRVTTLDGSVLAWTYVLNAYEGGLPSARYLGVIADAAYEAGAPTDYIAALRARECRGIPD